MLRNYKLKAFNKKIITFNVRPSPVCPRVYCRMGASPVRRRNSVISGLSGKRRPPSTIDSTVKGHSPLPQGVVSISASSWWTSAGMPYSSLNAARAAGVICGCLVFGSLRIGQWSPWNLQEKEGKCYLLGRDGFLDQTKTWSPVRPSSSKFFSENEEHHEQWEKIATKEESKDLPVKGRDYSFEHEEWQTRLEERCLSSEASDCREAVGAKCGRGGLVMSDKFGPDRVVPDRFGPDRRWAKLCGPAVKEAAWLTADKRELSRARLCRDAAEFGPHLSLAVGIKLCFAPLTLSAPECPLILPLDFLNSNIVCGFLQKSSFNTKFAGSYIKAMGSTSQPRPVDNHHKAAGATTTNNHHVGAPVLSKMIRQDLITMKEAMVEVQKKTDHINVQINQVCETFEVLETRGGNETQRELGELKNDVKKLKSQIPSKLIKVNPADSQPRQNPWLDGSINHNSNQDNINKAGDENILYSLHKDPKFEHNTAFQQFEVSFLSLPFTLRDCLLCFLRFPEMVSIKKFIIYRWIGEGFLPPNPEDQKTKEEIALGKTEEDFGNEIFGELIAKDFIEPIYKSCSLVTNSYRMLPFIRSALTIMAERFGFSPVYTLGPDTSTLAQYNEYQCLLNVGAAIIDGGPKLFSKMNHFKILYLERWQRSVTHHIEVANAKILHGLKKMNQLRFLSLRGISLITELPQFISWLTSLKILDLKACHNLEVVPYGIGFLKNLTHLDMSECYLLEHMPKEPYASPTGSLAFRSLPSSKPVTKLPSSLQKLELECTPFTVEWLLFANLKNLKKVYIRGGLLCFLGPMVATTVEILRLKYLSEFEMNWREFRRLFPNLIYVEKLECPGLNNFPCDENVLGIVPWFQRNQAYRQKSPHVPLRPYFLVGASSLSPSLFHAPPYTLLCTRVHRLATMHLRMPLLLPCTRVRRLAISHPRTPSCYRAPACAISATPHADVISAQCRRASRTLRLRACKVREFVLLSSYYKFGLMSRGNKVWFKNHAKRRTLSGPESRRAAEGSENRKLVSKREKWSTTTKRLSTDHSLPPGKRNRAWPANQAKSQRVQRPGGKAPNQNSGNSKRAQHAQSPSAQSMMSES
ncbi:hypothetical protein HYC85_030481 [Camellia sinensis]|uniref:NB-ARC domain-containing protein n=1 Tax=Camellia sinensis TaxID=4442 RepID=A0A7J7G0U0_CAMSI|nr:hypothetical protein HYC85_030481 [Camellia sinensis]